MMHAGRVAGRWCMCGLQFGTRRPWVALWAALSGRPFAGDCPDADAATAASGGAFGSPRPNSKTLPLHVRPGEVCPPLRLPGEHEHEIENESQDQRCFHLLPRRALAIANANANTGNPIDQFVSVVRPTRPPLRPRCAASLVWSGASVGFYFLFFTCSFLPTRFEPVGSRPAAGPVAATAAAKCHCHC